MKRISVPWLVTTVATLWICTECSRVPRGSDHLIERQTLRARSVITTLDSGEAPGAGSLCFPPYTSKLLS